LIATLFAAALCSEGQAKGQRPQHTTTNDQRGTAQNPFVVETYSAPKTPEEARADQAEAKRKADNDGEMTALTGALAFIGALQLIVFGYQAFVLRRTLLDNKNVVSAAQRSAQAAEDAVKKSETVLAHAQETAQRQLRAYVFVKNENIDTAPGGALLVFPVKISNAGQTPAHHLTVDCYVGFAPSEDELPWPDDPEDGSRASLAPGDSIWCTESHAAFTPQAAAALDNNSVHFFIFGSITYEDIFGILRHTEFRYRLRKQRHGWIMAVCGDGNDAT
jgi:hypothetical protein